MEETVAKLGRAVDRVVETIDRYAWAFAALLGVVFLAAAVGQSAQKSLWFDELANFNVASLPSLADVWNFFAQGLDTPSPIPTVLLHFFLKNFGSNEVMVRLPQTLGYVVMTLCLFGLIKRRYGALPGLVGMLIASIGGVFYYASEARAYGIILGSLSLAIIAWEGLAGRGVQKVLAWLAFTVFLGFSLSLHVFVAFAFVPFAAAELVRQVRHKRLDLLPWVGMALAVVVQWPLLKGMVAAKASFAGSFWSKPSPPQLFQSYSSATDLLWVLPVLVAVLVALGFAWRGPAKSRVSSPQGYSVEEWVLFAGIATIPLFALPASVVLGVYVPRYVLYLELGVVLCFAGLVARVLQDRPRVLLLLVLVLAGVFLRSHGSDLARLRPNAVPVAGEFRQQEWFQDLSGQSLPVLVPHGSLFLVVNHYSNESQRSNFYYGLETPPLLSNGEDQGNRTFVGNLRPILGGQIVEYREFVARNPEFLVLFENPLTVPLSWENGKIELVRTYAPGPRMVTGRVAIYHVSTVP